MSQSEKGVHGSRVYITEQADDERQILVPAASSASIHRSQIRSGSEITFSWQVSCDVNRPSVALSVQRRSAIDPDLASNVDL